MHTVKLTRAGNSLAVVLPKEVLAHFRLEKGDTLFITATPGGVMLTPYDPTLDEQLQAGHDVLRELRSTLHVLPR